MNGKLNYAIVQISDDQRGERLNAGIVILTEAGIDVRLPRRLEKLRALSSGLDLEAVRATLEGLSDIDRFAFKSGITDLKERLKYIAASSPFEFSELATFVAPSADAYENWVKRLLSHFVEPEAALPTKTARRTRLTTSIKSAFRDQRILARKGEGLGAHRIVSNVQIVDGLSADFVLKNGAMHVIETVDASSDVITLRKAISEIAVSALVLEQARMTFGEKGTHARLIYDASPSIEKLALPSLDAAAHQGAKLVNWASHDERKSFLDQLAYLADPLPSKGKDPFVSLHASTQGRLKLN